MKRHLNECNNCFLQRMCMYILYKKYVYIYTHIFFKKRDIVTRKAIVNMEQDKSSYNL